VKNDLTLYDSYIFIVLVDCPTSRAMRSLYLGKGRSSTVYRDGADSLVDLKIQNGDLAGIHEDEMIAARPVIRQLQAVIDRWGSWLISIIYTRLVDCLIDYLIH
jgi:hypothetical protein